MEFGQEINATYRMLGEIGSGGGGTVYKAYHIRLKKQVVFKKMHRSLMQVMDPAKEADILKNLHHPYLPQVLDFLTIDGDVYTVMDFVPGESFEQLVKKGTRFSQKQITKYAAQLSETLAYLHGQKPAIIHGDIKPANIMLTPQDNICLIDFNISGFMTEGNFLTLGYSAGFASPEQQAAVEQKRKQMETRQGAVSGLPSTGSVTIENQNRRIDERSDIYSAGATLYYIAAGVKPVQTADGIRHPAEINTQISKALDFILMKALNPRPADRFQNAQAMHKAILDIYKLDRRYRLLIFRQNFTYLFWILIILAGVWGTLTGWQKVKEERILLYEDTVFRMQELRDSQDTEEFLALYEKAVKMFPERTEAYYQRAMLLYEQREYEKDIKFISEQVIYDSEISQLPEAGDLFFILANCYFELEDYEHAVVDFRTAVRLNGDNPEYFQDYAVSLARLGKIDEASDILETAEQKGLSSAGLCVVRGEIALAKQEYSDAEDEFNACIVQTDDMHLKMRAYVMADKTLAAMGKTEENCLRAVSLLTQACAELPTEELLLIEERLAQNYIDLGDMTGNNSYRYSAIEIFDKIIQQGWATNTTYNNIVVLYQKAGDYPKAAEVLQEMLRIDDADYTVYKRLAFLEVDIQQEKDSQVRDYAMFKTYYEKAVELYQKAANQDTDAEMQLLDQVYTQLVNGRWL